MNSAPSALVWEIWRKNRWGFVLLLVFLGTAAALVRYPVWLGQRAVDLQASLPRIVGDELRGTEILPPQPAATPPAAATSPEADAAAPTARPQPHPTNPAELKRWLRYGLLPGARARAMANPQTKSYQAQTVRFSYGTNVIYDGLFRPDDVLAWSGLREKAGIVRFTLNGRLLYEGLLEEQVGFLSRRGSVSGTTAPAQAGEATRSDMVVDRANGARAVAGAPTPSATPPQQPAARPPRGYLAWTRADGEMDFHRVTLSTEYSPEVIELESAAATWREWAFGWGGMLSAFSFLILCFVFAGAEPHSASGFTGIPARRFTLPVSTFDLVARPISLGVLTLLVLFSGWAMLVFRPLTPTMGLDDYLSVGALLTAGLVLFQALVWGLPSFPKLRAWLLGIMMFGLVTAIGVVLDAQNHPEVHPHFANEATGVFAVLAGLGAWAAWLGVRLERQGHWASWRGWDLSSSLPVVLRPSGRVFNSALQAQLWVEWRRNARFPFCLWMGVMGLLLVADVGGRLELPRLKWMMDVVLPTAVQLVPVWVAVVGLNLARDAGSRRLALSSFMATRPVGTETLLLAKLITGVLFWLGAVLLLVIAVLCAPTGFPPGRGATDMVIAVVVLFHVFVGILPLCLSGRMPGIPWSLLPLLLVYGLLINLLAWLNRHPETYGPCAAAVVVLVLVKLGVGFWGFGRSLRLRLISSGFVVGYTGLWLGATVALGTWAWQAGARADWNREALLLVPAAVLVVPLARIAVSPLALALNRHR